MNISPSLSIVIIARNEAENVARAIESVLREVEHWPQTEILLVDSASTDETVEIARQYPISIVCLDPSWFLSASAGRYIGMHYTRGDLILYLDGDMELVTGWMDQAVPFILAHPELAGVSGYLRDVHPHDGQINSEQDLWRDSDGHPAEVRDFGGAALYRRSALKQVGGFNPYLISEEEPELCMRLRYAGYNLIHLPFLMGRHYCIPQKSLAGQLRRARLNYFSGLGQVPRYHLGTRLFWIYLKERGSFVVFLAAVLISMITLLLTTFLRDIVFFGTWLLIVSGVLSVFLIKKRSLRKTCLSLLLHALVAYNAVRGLLMTPRFPEEYPTDAEVVQVYYDGRRLA